MPQRVAGLTYPAQQNFSLKTAAQGLDLALKSDYRKFLGRLSHLASQASSSEELEKILGLEAEAIKSKLLAISPSWENLNDFFNHVLYFTEPIPLTKLTATPLYRERFNDREIAQLLLQKLGKIYGFLVGLVEGLMRKEGRSSADLDNILSIGTNVGDKAERFGLRLFRLAEVTSLVTSGYGIPARIVRKADPQKEFAGREIAGLLYRWGPLQMAWIREARKVKNLSLLLFDQYDITRLGREKIVTTQSGLYFDRKGQLTLASFKKPLRIDHISLPPPRLEYQVIEETGTPMLASHWANQLIQAKDSKLYYPQLLEKSPVVFVPQLNWYRKDSLKGDRLEVEREITRAIVSFVKRHGLDSIFVKPAKGTGGRDIKKFANIDLANSKRLAEIAGFIYQASLDLGDLIIQKTIELKPFREVIAEGIKLGKLTGRLEGVLEDIFGHPVAKRAEIDWLFRTFFTFGQKGKPWLVANFIVANDQGVANISQGGVTVLLDKVGALFNLDKLEKSGQEFLYAVEKKAMEKEGLGVSKPRDGYSNHKPGFVCLEWMYNQKDEYVFLEAAVSVPGLGKSYDAYLGEVKKRRKIKDEDFWLVKILENFRFRARNHRLALAKLVARESSG